MTAEMNGSTDFIGAGQPPPGVVPNFVNPHSIGYQLVIIAAVFPAITGVLLLLRLYTASSILKRWHLDDYLIVIAFVWAQPPWNFISLATATNHTAHVKLLGVGDSIVNIIMCTAYGGGTHIWDLTKPMYRDFNRLGLTAGPMLFHLSTLFNKLSILCFYLRFSSANLAFRLTVYAVMVFATGYTIPSAIGFLYQSSPMAATWDERIIATRQIDIELLCNVGGVMNTVTDFTILLLPIWLLQPLRIPLAKKIAVTLILMTGGFVCGVSVVRTATQLRNTTDTDFTYRFVPNLVWFMVEMYVGILCACLPCLKPFIRHHFPNFSIFASAGLESAISTSVNVVSARVETITSSFRFGGRKRRGEGGGAMMSERERREWRDTRSMSRVGAEMLQSKPSQSSMFQEKSSQPSSSSDIVGGYERADSSEGPGSRDGDVGMKKKLDV